MQSGRSKHEMCLLFDPWEENTCYGASGRKLMMVCLWCPNLRRQETTAENDDEKEGEENAGR